jgi:flagellar basal-body rod protein FlgB
MTVERRDRSTGNPLAATGNPLPLPLPIAGIPPLSTPPVKNWHGHCRALRVNFRAGDRHMANDSLFGVHAAALEVRSQRMGLLASNIANASTPGFKAKDIDFAEALGAAENAGGFDAEALQGATKFRVPLEMSMDGNTVDLSTEQTAFAENAIAYQTTLSFLNGRIGQITRALRGE